MSENFKLYSAYYDLMYEDKDYASEAAYVNRHLKTLLPSATRLLELGCGTGNHARFLCDHGYTITGVERSEEMIALAQKKSIKNFSLVLADITEFNFNQQFDAVIALFHSMCYLTTNDQLLNAFRRISKHLKPGGVFAFDFWYGPAVLHHLPISQSRRRQNELVEVIRNGETTMFIDENVAEVNYEIIVNNKSDGASEMIYEKHSIRYFTIPEITFIANQTGLKLTGFEEFLTGNQPTLETRNVFVMLQKI